MRDFAKFPPSFWAEETGQWIRSQGPDCMLVAVYLMTCPSSTMIGLFYLPLVTLAHETGLDIEVARKAIEKLKDAPTDAPEGEYQNGFAWYDEGRGIAWLPQMARQQLGERMKADDNRSKGARKDAEQWRKCKFYSAFYALYNEPFSLDLQSPLQGPSKTLRSKEIETEIQRENESKSETPTGINTPARTQAGNHAPKEPHDQASGQTNLQGRLRVDSDGRNGCREDRISAGSEPVHLRDDKRPNATGVRSDGGGPTQGLDAGHDAKAEPLTLISQTRAPSKADVLRATAIPILTYLSQARRRVKPSCRDLDPLPPNLKHIEGRLRDGYTADQLRHVVDVWESKARGDPANFQYFNPVTPFRESNIAQYVAMDVRDAGKGFGGNGRGTNWFLESLKDEQGQGHVEQVEISACSDE